MNVRSWFGERLITNRFLVGQVWFNSFTFELQTILLFMLFSCLLSFSRSLLLTEASVDSIWVFSHQVFMVSHFFQLPSFKNTDFISISDSTKSMCNDNNSDVSNSFSVFINCVLNSFLIYLIKSWSSFIQKKYSWLLDKCSGYSDSLFLATRELSTTRTNICFFFIGEFFDEVPGICVL